MSSTFRVCRDVTFKGTMTEYSVLEHISVQRETETYRREFCARGADEKEATTALDGVIDGWCQKPRTVFDQHFECQKMIGKGPAQVMELKGRWDCVVAFFGDLFR